MPATSIGARGTTGNVTTLAAGALTAELRIG